MGRTQRDHAITNPLPTAKMRRSAGRPSGAAGAAAVESASAATAVACVAVKVGMGSWIASSALMWKPRSKGRPMLFISPHTGTHHVHSP